MSHRRKNGAIGDLKDTTELLLILGVTGLFFYVFYSANQKYSELGATDMFDFLSKLFGFSGPKYQATTSAGTVLQIPQSQKNLPPSPTIGTGYDYLDEAGNVHSVGPDNSDVIVGNVMNGLGNYHIRPGVR